MLPHCSETREMCEGGGRGGGCEGVREGGGRGVVVSCVMSYLGHRC